jgi:hypothetical protein
MSKLNRHDEQQDSTMKVVIIYDNIASVMEANSSLRHSARHPDINVQWSIRPWQVDLLKFPTGAEESLTDAIDAHLIVLAGRCAQTFPFWLQDWLENWAKCRQIKDAALAVVGGGKAELLSSSQPNLSQFAGRHSLSIIFDDRSTLPILNAKNYDEYRNWGINE